MARRFIAPLVATSLVLLSSPAAEAADTPDFGMLADTVCTKANQAVDEKGFVRIGGMDQWVRIKGSSCTNPIIVLIHGGPATRPRRLPTLCTSRGNSITPSSSGINAVPA